MADRGQEVRVNHENSNLKRNPNWDLMTSPPTSPPESLREGHNDKLTWSQHIIPKVLRIYDIDFVKVLLEKFRKKFEVTDSGRVL